MLISSITPPRSALAILPDSCCVWLIFHRILTVRVNADPISIFPPVCLKSTFHWFSPQQHLIISFRCHNNNNTEIYCLICNHLPFCFSKNQYFLTFFSKNFTKNRYFCVLSPEKLSNIFRSFEWQQRDFWARHILAKRRHQSDQFHRAYNVLHHYCWSRNSRKSIKFIFFSKLLIFLI